MTARSAYFGRHASPPVTKHTARQTEHKPGPETSRPPPPKARRVREPHPRSASMSMRAPSARSGASSAGSKGSRMSRSSYRKVAHTSQVDETLFGNTNTPSAQKRRPQNSADVISMDTIEQLVGKTSLSRAADAVVINTSDLDRMRASDHPAPDRAPVAPPTARPSRPPRWALQHEARRRAMGAATTRRKLCRRKAPARRPA